jgi:hypothetical protein
MEPVCETLSSASAHVQGLGSPAMLLSARYRPDDSGVVRKETLWHFSLWCTSSASQYYGRPCAFLGHVTRMYTYNSGDWLLSNCVACLCPPCRWAHSVS